MPYTGAPMDTAPDPFDAGTDRDRGGEINRALEEQDKLLELATGALNNLQGRLTPFLQPERAEPKSDGGNHVVAAPEPVSPVLGQIRGSNRRLQGIIMRVSGMEARVE
jgi:hypothetical protein